MNKKELNKLKVMYDEYNECWGITNTTCLVADIDIGDDLELHKNYLDLLISNGGYNLGSCSIGFKTKEIAEKCLEAIKNYKEDDIIEKPTMKFKYKNWKDETSIRTVIPIEIWYGITDYHTENQWFLKAMDIDKQAKKDFAIKDIIEYIKAEER